MHDNRTIMDEDIQVSKFPHLEGHRKGTAPVDRPGNTIFIADEFISMCRLRDK